MALKANILKVNLSVADIDHHHYQDYRLTLAQHPSETDLRLAVRIAAFALYSAEEPEFTKGLCNDEEPELWTHSLTGEIEHWIELGQPSEKRVRQACSKAQKVSILGYHAGKFRQWYESTKGKLVENPKINVLLFENQGETNLEDLIQKGMDLSATIQDGQMLLSSDSLQVNLAITEFN